jgi:hypothetical protein
MTSAATPILDLSPIISAVMQLAATVILAAGGYAIPRVLRWLGLKESEQARAALDSALHKAVTYGLQQSQALIKSKGWDHPQVRNAALADAATYLTTRFADTLKAVGTDVAKPEAVEAVRGALERAFPAAVADAADSPATPPKTAPNPPEQKDLPPRAPSE